jgi:hypothetical protein
MELEFPTRVIQMHNLAMGHLQVSLVVQMSAFIPYMHFVLVVICIYKIK